MQDDSERFEHQRHKPPRTLTRPRGLLVVCAPLRSQVNLSRLARAAGCFGIQRIIACGPAKLDRKIARDAAESLQIDSHRSLKPLLPKLKNQGFRLVGLEQASSSHSIFEYRFEHQTALVVGNERSGLGNDEMALLDDVIEIPVYGMPYSFNVATATCLAMYEYCRQFPDG